MKSNNQTNKTPPCGVILGTTKTQTTLLSRLSRNNKIEVVRLLPKQTKYGGTSFLESTLYVKGAPKQPKEHIGSMAIWRNFEWQFRCTMAFREYSDHDCAFITLTYREPEPASWDTCRTDIDGWLKRLRKYHERVLAKAIDEPKHLYTRPKYIIVEENGKLNGRKHFHALIFTAKKYSMRLANYRDPACAWRHGFIDAKRVNSKYSGQRNLAIYISKYVNKSHGRNLCSFNFGLTTTTILLSISSWEQLYLINQTLFQKLLRRLSLTANYPTSNRLNSLHLRQMRWTTSQLRLHPPGIHRPVIGSPETGSLIVSKEDAGTLSYKHSNALRSSSYPLVKRCIQSLKAPDATPLCKQAASCLPGLALFAKGPVLTNSARLEPDKATAVWFAKSAHKRSAAERARNTTVQVPQ